MKDLVGREMTPVERKILRAYDGLAALLREPGLSPTVVSNLKEAASSLWICVNALALRAERDDDLAL